VSLDHAILGFLVEQPAHGYSIKKRLFESLSRDVGLNDGQLYPALARLESRGWIKKRVVAQRRSPPKHLWRATAAGQREFRRWLETPEPEPDAAVDFLWRHGFLQRCAFFRHLDAHRVATHARRELEGATRGLAELERLSARLAAQGADPYRRLLVEYGIRYQRMRREWLEELFARAAPTEGEKSPPLRAVASDLPARSSHV
jgi:DNA-binding PadR family transcriptional regulator